jgi:HPt (histidine-containing phosphotransfer) domain-containing protein
MHESPVPRSCPACGAKPQEDCRNADGTIIHGWHSERFPGDKPPPSPTEANQRLLENLWYRNMPMTQSRLDLLDAAALAASNGTLTQDVREGAASTAHKMAGSLGMFGYQRGTHMARELEQLLESGTAPDGERLTALAGQLRAELTAPLGPAT